MAQNPELVAPVEEPFAARVSGLSHTVQCMKNIKTKLSGGMMKRFKKSCFGHLLGIEKVNFSGQLVHAVLMRAIKSEISGESMSFWFGGQILRFDARDFCLITGLRFGDLPTLEGADINSRLKGLYFPDKDRVSTKDLEYAFKGCTDEEDMYKLSLVYFVEFVLLGRDGHGLIELKYLWLVEDLKAWRRFPWGSVSFDYTFASLSNAALTRYQIFKDKGGKGDVYSLRGFPCTFQIWAYESFPILSKCHFAMAVDCEHPARILHWASRVVPTFKSLRLHLLNKKKVEVRYIRPTEVEKKAKYWRFEDDEDIRDTNLVARENVIPHPAVKDAGQATSSNQTVEALKAQFEGFKAHVNDELRKVWAAILKHSNCDIAANDQLMESKGVMINSAAKVTKEVGTMWENLVNTSLGSEGLQDNPLGFSGGFVNREGRIPLTDLCAGAQTMSEPVANLPLVNDGQESNHPADQYSSRTNVGYEIDGRARSEGLEEGSQHDGEASNEIFGNSEQGIRDGDEPNERDEHVHLDDQGTEEKLESRAVVASNEGENEVDNFESYTFVNELQDPVPRTFTSTIVAHLTSWLRIVEAKAAEMGNIDGGKEDSDLELISPFAAPIKRPPVKRSTRSKRKGSQLQTPFTALKPPKRTKARGPVAEVHPPPHVHPLTEIPRCDMIEMLRFVHSWASTPTELIDIGIFSVDGSFFLRLIDPDLWLDNQHIDAGLQLLRQRQQELPEYFGQHWTTADAFFMQHLGKELTSLTHCKEKSKWAPTTPVLRYISGDLPQYGYPWSSVNQIYIPFNVGSKHWVLVMLDLILRQIIVYDSMTDRRAFLKLKGLLQPLSVVVPYLLVLSGFYTSRTDIQCDQTLQLKPIPIAGAPDVPQQVNGSDCGVFTVKFVEFLTCGAPIQSCVKEHIPYFRLKLGVELLRRSAYHPT